MASVDARSTIPDGLTGCANDAATAANAEAGGALACSGDCGMEELIDVSSMMISVVEWDEMNRNGDTKGTKKAKMPKGISIGRRGGA